MADFQLPGEFVYDGMHLSNIMTSAKMIDGVKELTLKPEDTVVATYAKSGTTWMKYVAYLIEHNGDESDPSIPFVQILPYLEMVFPGSTDEQQLKILAEMPSPRLFCTHLPFRVLKKQALENKVKFIVVIRNPKDTLVSNYNFYLMNRLVGYNGTWDEFFPLFKEKKLYGGDLFDYNVEWWKVKDHDNILVVTYEEMKEDLTTVVRKAAKFMSRDLTEDVIQKIVHLTSFNQMKANPRVNGQVGEQMGKYDFKIAKFLRKGVVGDWTNYFSEAQSQYVDNLCKEKYDPVGLTSK